MYHLRLSRGLSYAGEVNGEAVRATKSKPNVRVEKEETAAMLASSGFFTRLEVDTEELVSGKLDKEQFEEWTLAELAKLASDMEIDTAGLDRDALIEAISSTEVKTALGDEDEAETSGQREAEVRAELMERTVEQLKEIAAQRGVELKGAKSKEKIVDALIEADRHAAEVRAALRSDD